MTLSSILENNLRRFVDNQEEKSCYIRIYHIGVHKLYDETRALFSSTKSRIYDKEKHKQVTVIICYKSAMELNKLLFETIVSKIGHSRVGQAQVASKYVQVVSQ